MIRFNNLWKLYELVNKEPIHTITEYSVMIKWSRKKTIKYLERLHKDKMIKLKLNRYYPTPVKELINWEEFNKKFDHEYFCKTCKDTGRVMADIPYFAIPDVNNCNFTEECPECKDKNKKRGKKYDN